MDITSVGIEKLAGAIVRRCSVIRFFEKLCKIHRKIPVLKSLFNEVSHLELNIRCIFPILEFI